MSIYLKAKHWQLFIALVSPMVLAQATMARSILNSDSPNPLAMAAPAFIMTIVLFGWLWSIASACSTKLPPGLVSSTKLMRFCLVYALVFIFISSGAFYRSSHQLPSYMVVMHLLAMGCIFYSLGFTAKQLAKLEQGKDVSFFSYSGPFFLLWLFPLGIWFIQPKVNQLLGDGNT